jgi:fatty-acyl-CoA synthase
MQLDTFLQPRPANHQPLTPVNFLWRAAEAHPDRAAVVDGAVEMSWRSFAEFVRRFAGALQSRGIASGEVISVMAPNSAEMLAAHYAVPMVGGVLNTLNVRLDAETLAYILEHSESSVLITHANYREAVTATVRRLQAAPQVIWFGAGAAEAAGHTGITLDDFLAGAPRAAAHSIQDEWQPICLNYTSGTTGRPKGVVYHHRGAFLNALGNVLTMGFRGDTRYLWVLPMFHCNGWTHTWAVTAAGGTHICVERTDPAAIMDALVHQRVTHLCCAPVVLYMLINDPVFAALRLQAPVVVGTGGASPSSKLISALESAGLRLIHLYGLTESYGPATHCSPGPDWGEISPREKSVRLARHGVPHVLASDLKIVGRDGAELPYDGESVGEIVLHGNTLMAGYYRDGPATEKAFEDSVFHTGDLAVRHENGEIEIRDRAKDLIISGGENIASVEIEHVLHEHPAVLLAAVVAMPHDKWGEVPCAFVELRPEAAPTSEEELIAHCRQRLAGFKRPKRIIFQSVPRTATGKIQKFLLRKVASELTLGRGE